MQAPFEQYLHGCRRMAPWLLLHRIFLFFDTLRPRVIDGSEGVASFGVGFCARSLLSCRKLHWSQLSDHQTSHPPRPCFLFSAKSVTGAVQSAPVKLPQESNKQYLKTSCVGGRSKSGVLLPRVKTANSYTLKVSHPPTRPTHCVFHTTTLGPPSIPHTRTMFLVFGQECDGSGAKCTTETAAKCSSTGLGLWLGCAWDKPAQKHSAIHRD